MDRSRPARLRRVLVATAAAVLGALILIPGTASAAGTGTITVHNAWAMGGEPGRITVRSGGETTEETIPAADHYALQVAAFSDAIRSGGPSPHPVGESLATVRACAALVRSAGTQQAVPIAAA